jgi:N-ethylmaleimide reductase
MSSLLTPVRIGDLDLPKRIAQGAALNTPDPSTFYGTSASGYTDYPALI